MRLFPRVVPQVHLVAGALLALFAQLPGIGTTWAAPRETCVPSGEQACLLGDRFRVRVFYPEDGSNEGANREARLLGVEGTGEESGQDTAQFSFSAPDQPDRVDLTVRLVDGRSMNGYFWLLPERSPTQAGSSTAQIEVTDVALGRMRRFTQEAGFLDVPAIDAFSGEAQTVAVTLDTARAVQLPIGTEGGSIAVVDAQGTRFQVVFPAQALNLRTDITLTPVVAIAGLPLSGGLRGAVHIEPEGLVPARSVRLTITPAPAVSRAQLLTFAFRGLAGEFFLTPPLLSPPTLVVPVHRLGGYGLAAGSAADLSAQLLRQPTREEDRLTQKLAGILLPLRRAGKKAVPQSVTQLLQQEWTANINPKLAAVRGGEVAKHYAKLRNWSLSARDTGLVKAVGRAMFREDGLAILEARVRAAVLEGVRRDFLRQVDVCIGLKDKKAMRKAFNAFAELAREAALKPGDAEKLKRCARFELRWDTELLSDAAPGWKAVTTAQVQLTYSQGKFSGANVVSQTPSLTVPAPCSSALLSTTPVTLTVDRLEDPNLNFWDDEVVNLQVKLYYILLPVADLARWRISCPDGAPFETAIPSVSLYLSAHASELGADFLLGAALFPRPGDFRIYGERTYQRTVELITEDTALILQHNPQ